MASFNLTTIQQSSFLASSSSSSSPSSQKFPPRSAIAKTICRLPNDSDSFTMQFFCARPSFFARGDFAPGYVRLLSQRDKFDCCAVTSDSQAVDSAGGDDGDDDGTGDGNGGGGGGDNEGQGGNDSKRNRIDSILTLVNLGKVMADLPPDLAAAVQQGRIPAAIVSRYFELSNNVIFRWLLQFGGFRERLLADDLFLTKVAIECGVGIFTKTAAELERRRDNFSKELDFVFADVVMALIADFMLVWLPAPTISLRTISKEAGAIAKFFYGCPDNAFQVALLGTSYTLVQRIGAIVRNGGKLIVVGTSASLVGTGITNALILLRKSIDKDFIGQAEDLPILSTSLAYGVYMAVSSNLRYQVLAGVIEQRILEPWLHGHKLALSIICFAVRTGNTFLGSLMWVDYARWVGVQKIRE